MNAARRKEIKEAVKVMLQAQDLMLQASEMLESVMYDEQEAFDNMPEGLQESERGQHMQECIDNLDDVISRLQDDIDFDDIECMLEDM